MSVSLTLEEEARYAAIIDAILATADLETVTRKKVRMGLEKAVGKDLSEQKDAIKSLIEARFDAVSSAAESANTAAVPPAATDGASKKEEYIDSGTATPDTDTTPSLSPTPKKTRREESSEEADARLAAALQAQENQLARGRTTRGSATGNRTKKATPQKRKPKSSKRVREDGDSDDGDGGDKTPSKRRAGGGFQKPFNLSSHLAELCGTSQLSRPQVVKKLWEHIKTNSLQDPTDKRQIRCDELMHAVFKQSKVDMFQMNKIIGNHLYPVEEE